MDDDLIAAAGGYPPAGRLPRPQEVHVWSAAQPENIGRLAILLDGRERARADGYRRAADAHRFIAGRALLRLLLARYLDVDVRRLELDATCPHCGGPHGKPLPRQSSGLDASLSRSGNRLLIAVGAGAQLGADIELVRSLAIPDLARMVLAPEEVIELGDLDETLQLAALFAHWSRKEALLKATGHGLALDMRTISLGHSSRTILRLPSELGSPEDWSLVPVDVGRGAAAAVAVRVPMVELRRFHVAADWCLSGSWEC